VSGGSRRVLDAIAADEALELLADSPYGRIVFVRDGEPAIRPLNHIVDNGEVIIRTHLGAALTEALAASDGLRVAYQADLLDAGDRLGWSVTVTGTAVVVDDPARRHRCTQVLRPWLDKTNDTVIAIRPHSVTGYRIVAAP